MERLEIKNFVNKVIEREHGKELEENDLFTECQIDSFGYALLWLEIAQEYKCVTVDYVNTIDYKTYRLIDLIDYIERNHNDAC